MLTEHPPSFVVWLMKPLQGGRVIEVHPIGGIASGRSVS